MKMPKLREFLESVLACIGCLLVAGVAASFTIGLATVASWVLAS